jgi:hypothetical protein
MVAGVFLTQNSKKCMKKKKQNLQQDSFWNSDCEGIPVQG